MIQDGYNYHNAFKSKHLWNDEHTHLLKEKSGSRKVYLLLHRVSHMWTGLVDLKTSHLTLSIMLFLNWTVSLHCKYQSWFPPHPKPTLQRRTTPSWVPAEKAALASHGGSVTSLWPPLIEQEYETDLKGHLSTDLSATYKEAWQIQFWLNRGDLCQADSSWVSHWLNLSADNGCVHYSDELIGRDNPVQLSISPLCVNMS